MCCGICERLCGCSLIDDVSSYLLGERDLDDVFAYKTPVVAVIRDRKLGILRMLFMTGIFFYIIVYDLVMQKGYAELGIARSTLDIRFETPSSHFNCSSRLNLYSNIDAQFNLPQDELQLAFNSCNFSDSVAHASSFPFCMQSSEAYPFEKKTCAVQYDELETSERVSGSSFFVPTSLRTLYQRPVLDNTGNGGHLAMAWVPDQTFANHDTPPLGFDVWRRGGFFFPFVTDLVMVLSHTLQVVNFDLQRSSANMHGFLISHNREYCDSLEFADSKDLLEPNKKYPHDAEMANSIRDNNGLKLANASTVNPLCLVNFNRSSECVDKRKTARRDGSDLNRIMKMSPDCFEDRIRVGSLFQTLDRTDDRENPVLNSLNPTRNETYRSTGMHMQVKLSYTNEDSVSLREPTGYGDHDVYFTITASAVPNSTSTITKLKESFSPQNKISINGVNTPIPMLHQRRLVERRTGITFDFIPISNRVMRFTFSKFMGVLTASIVMFGVASSIVDNIMLSPRLFSWRAKLYESMKYVRSKDFSDLKDARDRGELGEKVNPRASHSVPVAAVALQRTKGDHDKRQFEEANTLALNMIELSESAMKKNINQTVVHD